MQDMFNAGAELVGTEVLDTIGLMIANIDTVLRERMNIPDRCRAVGLIGSRTAAAAQITAADDAAKMCDVEIVSIELPRDTKGWGGHGCFIIFGGETPSDVRRAVEICLENIHRNAGEVYISQAGHMEFQYSPNAYTAVNKAFGVPVGQPFGFVCASPAPIGLMIADKAAKSGNIEFTRVMRPSEGTSHSNEVIAAFTGETSAVKNAVIRAREMGMVLLEKMGSPAPPVTEPYIK